MEALSTRIRDLEAKLAAKDKEKREDPDSASSSDEEVFTPPAGNQTVQVPWAHKLVSRPPSARQPTKDNLSIPELVGGYLRAMQLHPSSMHATLTQHLVELMQDAVVFPWEGVRHFHNEYLTAIERNETTWTDVREPTRLRFLHLQAPSSAPSAAASTSSRRPRQKKEPIDPEEAQEVEALKAAGKKPCYLFQSDKCTTQAPHDDYLHLCAFCFYVRSTRQESHGEDKCITKGRSGRR